MKLLARPLLIFVDVKRKYLIKSLRCECILFAYILKSKILSDLNDVIETTLI